MEDNEKGKRRYVKTRLENWNDLSKLNPRFLMSFVFRGHGKCDWHIQSSLERLIERYYTSEVQQRIYPSGFEIDMLKDFQWKYPNYENINIPKDDEIIEWLSIMQHYGCCTRMVDFTFSPYVAMFMAIDSSEGNNDCTIWCLNHLIFGEIFSNEYKTTCGTSLDSKDKRNAQIYNEANQVLIDSINEVRRNYRPYVYLVKPHRANKRIVQQQGLFAIPERIDISFEENLFELVNNKQANFEPFSNIIDYSYSGKVFRPDDYVLIKIDIPYEFRYNITKSLYLMNLTAETMYPGLVGLAKSQNYQRLI